MERMSTNKNTLIHQVKSADIAPGDRSQLLSLIEAAPDTPDGLEALERRIRVVLGKTTEVYQSKVPKSFKTK